MTITLPDDMRDELTAGAAAAGFATIDEYVLIMYHRAKHLFGPNGEEWFADLSDGPPVFEGMEERLLALAEEGLRSPPIADPEAFLAELERKSRAARPAEAS